MKKTSILTSAILAAALTAASHANATVPAVGPWSTGNVSAGNPDVDGYIYSWTVSFASLLTGGNAAYSGANLTSGNLDVQILNDTTDLPVYATIFSTLPLGTRSGNLSPGNLVSIGHDYPSGSPGWVDFNIPQADLSIIQADYNANHNGSIEFSVEVDCELAQYNLTLGNSVPDTGSTMYLLGGVLTTLGLIKRKMA